MSSNTGSGSRARSARLAVASLLLLAAAASPADIVRFQAVLSGDQEVPPVATQAAGRALLELNDARDSLEIFITVFGLDFDGSTPALEDDVTGLHIHRAPAGDNGPVVFGLLGPDSDLDGDRVTLFTTLGGSLFSVWDGAEGNGTTLGAELGNLFNEGLYFNVHTAGNRGGEIRGQIQVVPLPAGVLLMAAALTVLAPLRRR